MARNLFATWILLVALAGAASAQGPASPVGNGTHYTHAQLKQLIREAHTPEQYNSLAVYYTEQQKNYLKQAEEERQEWLRRSQNITAVAAKYPRPVDSAHYLYEYYMSKASEAEDFSVKYGQMATAEAPAKAH